jgi:hypothetical protein
MSDRKTMNLKLHIWRQKGPDAPGKLEIIEARDIHFSKCSTR